MKFLTNKLRQLAALMVVVALPLTATAQGITEVGPEGPAFLQVIHNSADPAAAEVDIYLNGAVAIEGFEFRDATGFLELESGVEHVIGVAPAGGAVIATFEVTLAAATNYIAVASGVLTPGDFAANPDGIATAFNLEIIADVAQEASSNDDVIINVFHGATDAPGVDIVARADAPIVLVPGAAYTDAATITVAPAEYILNINVAGTQATVVAFDADLSGAGGAAVTVLASGFLDVEANEWGAQFGLLAVFADGTTAMLPALTASAQIIHNAADPAVEEVDVYLNGALFAADFPFRSATPFLDLPAGLAHYISFAAPGSESIEDALVTFEATLPEGAKWQFVANGVLDPTEFAANPDSEDTEFNLFALTMARDAAEAAGNVDFRVWHGATDAPTVDLRLTGGAVLAGALSYGDVSEYLSVPADEYVVDLTVAGDGSAVVATYTLDVSGLAGGSALAIASGFLAPANNNGGPAFEVLVVLADGTTITLPVATSIESDLATAPVAFELEGNFPNPFNPTTNIRFSVPNTSDVSLTVYDMLGRQVAVLVNGTMSAGTHTVTFDASNLSSGTYLYRLQSGSFVETSKMMLIK
ncbi:MAG: DUF4397 domain-containing protein [Bacteroidetes bacterium]|nr:DUF4397 domain-containing protein [Bacteroidota bacterium]